MDECLTTTCYHPENVDLYICYILIFIDYFAFGRLGDYWLYDRLVLNGFIFYVFSYIYQLTDDDDIKPFFFLNIICIL